MRVLVDTNILLRSAQPNHPFYSQAALAVSRLMRRNDTIFFCSQNIAEFWNVATRPADRNGMGLSIDEVLREIRSIENLFTLLPDIPAVIHSLERDCGRAKSSGRQSIRRATRCPYERLRDRANSYVQRSGFYPVYQHRRSSPGIYLK